MADAQQPPQGKPDNNQAIPTSTQQNFTTTIQNVNQTDATSVASLQNEIKVLKETIQTGNHAQDKLVELQQKLGEKVNELTELQKEQNVVFKTDTENKSGVGEAGAHSAGKDDVGKTDLEKTIGGLMDSLQEQFGKLANAIKGFAQKFTSVLSYGLGGGLLLAMLPLVIDFLNSPFFREIMTIIMDQLLPLAKFLFVEIILPIAKFVLPLIAETFAFIFKWMKVGLEWLKEMSIKIKEDPNLLKDLSTNFTALITLISISFAKPLARMAGLIKTTGPELKKTTKTVETVTKGVKDVNKGMATVAKGTSTFMKEVRTLGRYWKFAANNSTGHILPKMMKAMSKVTNLMKNALSVFSTGIKDVLAAMRPDKLINKLSDISQAFSDKANKLSNAIKNIKFPKIKDWKVVSGTMEKFTNFVNKIKNIKFTLPKASLKTPETLSKIAKAIGWVFGKITGFARGFASATGNIGKFIANTSKLIVRIVKAIPGISSFFKMLFLPFRMIGSAFGTVGKAVSGVSKFKGIISKIGGVLGKIMLPVTIIMGIWSAVSGAISGYEEGGVVGAIKGAFDGLYQFFIGDLLNLITDIIAWVGELFGFDMSFLDGFDLGAWVKPLLMWPIDIFNLLLDAFTNSGSIGEAIGKIIDGLGNIFGGIIYTVAEGLASLVGVFSETGEKKILEWVEDFKPKASGGQVMPGKYMINEQGAELVEFGSPATIHNATRTKQMMTESSQMRSMGGGIGALGQGPIVQNQTYNNVSNSIAGRQIDTDDRFLAQHYARL